MYTYQSFGGIPMKVIRYTPDEYVTNHKQQNPSFGTRMKFLSEHLRYAADDLVVSYLSVKYMFYNNRETTPLWG